MSVAWLCLAAGPPPASVAAPRASPGAIPDAQIERELKARLGRSKLAASHIQVRVQAGVVTLDGKTEVPQHKGIATRMAKASGARAVNNRIEVSQAARERAASRLEAGRRKAAVQRVPRQ